MKQEERTAIFIRKSVREKIKKVADKNKRSVPAQLEWWAEQDLLVNKK